MPDFQPSGFRNAQRNLQNILPDLNMQSPVISANVQVRPHPRDRAICRSFTGTLAGGVACRENGRWALKALFPGEGQAGDYRMASGGDPRVLRTVTDAISGAPFDAGQERAAKGRHWTPPPR